MSRAPKPHPVAAVDPAGAAGAEAGAGFIATATAIATAAAAVAGAEIPAKVDGSRPRIIAIVPGSLANLAGNTHHVLEQLWPSPRASTQGDSYGYVEIYVSEAPKRNEKAGKAAHEGGTPRAEKAGWPPRCRLSDGTPDRSH